MIRLDVRPFERLLSSILLRTGNSRYGRSHRDVGCVIRNTFGVSARTVRISYAAGAGKFKGNEETPGGVFSPIKD